MDFVSCLSVYMYPSQWNLCCCVGAFHCSVHGYMEPPHLVLLFSPDAHLPSTDGSGTCGLSSPNFQLFHLFSFEFKLLQVADHQINRRQHQRVLRRRMPVWLRRLRATTYAIMRQRQLVEQAENRIL